MTVLGLNYEQILRNILENADLSGGWGDRLQSKALSLSIYADIFLFLFYNLDIKKSVG